MGVVEDAQIVAKRVLDGDRLISLKDVLRVIHTNDFIFKTHIVDLEKDIVDVAYSFDFNKDGVLDMYDFQYLLDHVQDLSIMQSLSKIGLVIALKYSKLSNIKLTLPIAQDMILRVITYCVLYIISNNKNEYIVWGSKENNHEKLFLILRDFNIFLKGTTFITEEFNKIIGLFTTKGYFTCLNRVNINMSSINVLYRDARQVLEKIISIKN